MELKKNIKSIIFVMLIAILFVFSGEKVDAASCKYEFVKMYNKNEVSWQASVVFEIAKDSSLRFQSAYLDTNNKGSDGYFILTGMEFDLKVENGTCPVLTLYGTGMTGTKWEVYSSAEKCKEDHFFCGDENSVTATGTLERDEVEEEVLPTGACPDEDIQGFNNKVSGITTDIKNKYNGYYDALDRISVADLSEGNNSSAIEAEQYLNGFSNEVKSIIRKIDGYSLEYGCAEIHEKTLQLYKDIETDGKSYFTQLYALWDFKLEQERINRVNKGDAEGAQFIETAKESMLEHRDSVMDDFDKYVYAYKDNLVVLLGADVEVSCRAILGDILDLIQWAFDVIKIVAPILLIVFGSMDFAKAVVASDDKMMKKATSDFMKRVAAAVLIFFIPFFINFLFNLPGIELGIENILCGIGKVVF